MERALDYMGLTPGTPLDEIAVDRVFIGSCTNSRIEDLRSAAAVVAQGPQGCRSRRWVVPGSGLVKSQAEAEGLDRDLPRRRLRVARARLLDVRRHERRHRQAAASAAPRPPTAISSAARARARARIS